MMIKLHKFERIAGIFVLIAVVGAIVVAVSVVIQRGWLAPKIRYVTTFSNADGVHLGTTVQIAGLKAGNVDEVELLSNNQIRVTVQILRQFSSKVKTDSKTQLIRPFVIGDRVLEISVGSEESQPLEENGILKSHETTDLMTVLSGRKLGEYIETMSGVAESLTNLVKAFTDKRRTESMVKTFDQLEPLVTNMNIMSKEVIKLSKQATRKDNLGTVLKNLSVTTNELNEMIPEFRQRAPRLGKDITKIVENLAVLTDDFKLLTPTLVEMAPELPKTSRRAIEALDEAVVLIKAMQKSMFMRGSVEDVREEEQKRIPATAPKKSESK